MGEKNNPHLKGTRDEFIAKNMKLVYSEAHKLRKFGLVNGIEYEDLVSIGSVGLVKAYDRFDPTKFEKFSPAFSTYAVPMIKGEILREVRDSSNGGLKVGRIPKEIGRKIQEKELLNFAVEEIMELFDCSNRVATDALAYANGLHRTNSMQATVYKSSDGEDITLEEQAGFEQDFSNIQLESFLDSLEERERFIVQKLFLEHRGQREVGELVGVSQVQISRILQKIREKARVYEEFGYTNKKLEPDSKTKMEKEKKRKEKEERRKKRMSKNPGKTTKAGVEKAKKLLAETDLTLAEIQRKTGIKYQTVHYHSTRVRGEKKVEQPKTIEQPSPKTAKRETKVQTTMNLNLGGEDVTVEELRENFARVLETLNATGAKNTKFNLQLQVKS